MPEYCFCIVEGRGRLLHDDPGLRRPITLAYSQPGDWLVGRDCYAVILQWLTAPHLSSSLALRPMISTRLSQNQNLCAGLLQQLTS